MAVEMRRIRSKIKGRFVEEEERGFRLRNLTKHLED